MKNPPYIQYQKKVNGEILTGFATSQIQLDAMIQECKDNNFIIHKIHRGG